MLLIGRNRLIVIMHRQSSLLLILAALSLAPTTQLRAAVEFPYEHDGVQYLGGFAGANQDVLNDQSMSGSVVSLTASEATTDVGVSVGDVLYNVPFDSGTKGQWVALAVPEPAKMALVVAVGALAFAILGAGKRREGIAKTFLRMLLQRLPPNRG